MRNCWCRMLWGSTTSGSNGVSPCAVWDLSLNGEWGPRYCRPFGKVCWCRKKGDVTPRRKKVLRGIYWGDEVAEVHGWSQKVGWLKTALGWRIYERNGGRNRVTRSSVRGTIWPGLSCAKGGTRWTNSEGRGDWPVGYSKDMDDAGKVKW